VSSDDIAQGIAESGKPVERVVIQEVGGVTSAIAQGCNLTQAMAEDASSIERELFPASELVLGIKCGGSDATSGLIANPAVGVVCDLLIGKGGTCIFGETTEFIGAEHILASRAVNDEVKARIINIVANMEKRASDMGFEMRGGQPTRGNINGGLTTIEEKSLGAISKSGSKPINGVYEYGERCCSKGLYIVDTPGREPEFLTALASAGAQVILFTTGLGATQGFPFIPVIKVTGNPITHERLPAHIDTYVDIMGESDFVVTRAAQNLYQEVLAVASGKQTKAEMVNYGDITNIVSIGPTM
jgi:altronate dehydratase large subunit